MAFGIKNVESNPGVIGSWGSTGKARGMQGDSETTIQKSDPVPAATFQRSGRVKIQVAEGPGGKTSLTFQTPEPSTPLKRIDLNA